MKFNQIFVAASFALALAAGCNGTSDVTDNGKAVSGVTVSPDKAGLAKGSMFQFTAMLEYADGTTKDVTSDSNTVWNTSDATVASVSSTGMVTAVAVGAVDVTADFKGEKGNEHFAVTP